jgi:hypothetical protein
LIKQEATSFFAANFREIKNKPMRFIVDIATAQFLVSRDSPLLACFGLKPRSLLRPWVGPPPTNAPQHHNAVPGVRLLSLPHLKRHFPS